MQNSQLTPSRSLPLPLSRPLSRRLAATRLGGLPRVRRQTGMSLFGWLVVLCVVGFAVNIGMKIVPHYMANNAIVGVIEGMSPEVWRGSSKNKMHETVDKGLKVNNIRALKSKDLLEIKRTPSITKVNLDYEVRENLFGNIDIVLVFKKDYQY